MQWILTSSFPVGEGWIFERIASTAHRFVAVEPLYRHDRSRAKAGIGDWLDYLRHAIAAWRRAGRVAGRVGIITVFPQLAVLVGVLKRLTGSRRPVVAMMFNLGRTYGGIQGALARFGLRSVDRFVVHSRHEIDIYSEWLGLPAERFVFVPLSIEGKTISLAEDEQRPFVLAMGTANRDYALLMRALCAIGRPAVVVAGAHALEGLAIPANVTVRSGLSIDECHALCQRARVSVVPLRAAQTASGQVSLLEAMMFGRAVVATRAVGTVDYVVDGVDGLLVPEGDQAAMECAIELLWTDAARRRSVAAAALRTATSRFTFAAAARPIEAILDRLVASAPSTPWQPAVDRVKPVR